MICLRWWELILALMVGEWIAGVIHVKAYGRRLGDRLARRLARHSDGSGGSGQ